MGENKLEERVAEEAFSAKKCEEEEKRAKDDGSSSSSARRCGGKIPTNSTFSANAKTFCEDVREKRADVDLYGFHKNVYANPGRRRLTNQSLIDRFIRERRRAQQA